MATVFGLSGQAVIVVCANCQAEARPAFLREIPPYGNAEVSHDLCEAHAVTYRAQVAERQACYAEPPTPPTQGERAP